MTVAAGRLLERVTIQRPTVTTDESGGQVTVWRNVVTAKPAEVLPISGRENTDTEALTGLSSYRVTFRFSSDVESVDATYRLKWRGDVLRVLGATHDRRARASILTCEAGAGVVTGGIEEGLSPSLALIFTNPTNSQYVPLVSF